MEEEDLELDRLLEIHDVPREMTKVWGRNEDWGEEKARVPREEAASGAVPRRVDYGKTGAFYGVAVFQRSVNMAALCAEDRFGETVQGARPVPQPWEGAPRV